MTLRKWRNWQTRTFEGRVVYTVRVQVPFSAPTKKEGFIPSFFVGLGVTRLEESRKKVLIKAEHHTAFRDFCEAKFSRPCFPLRYEVKGKALPFLLVWE